VDLDRSHQGGIIGLAAGRSGACVEGWLALQSSEFRAAVRVVAIDPSAPYAAGIRRALPGARIVLDHFHVVMLGNAAVTEVRQRALREQLGRRGMRVDPAWAHRRLLLRGGNQLSPKALTRLKTVLTSNDPTNEISAAWACTELLRQPLAAHGPTRYSRHETAHRRTRFPAQLYAVRAVTSNFRTRFGMSTWSPDTLRRLSDTLLKWNIAQVTAWLRRVRGQKRGQPRPRLGWADDFVDLPAGGDGVGMAGGPLLP
jgi:hypothetical protein